MKKSKSAEWTKPEINFVKREYIKGHGRKSISKMIKHKFGKTRTPDAIRHCIDTYCSDQERELPKVLIFDIETKPLIAETWGMYEQNINLDDIIEDWSIMSFSAKWIDSDKVTYADQRSKSRKNLYDDKNLVKKLRDLLDKADIVIGQNVKNFDIPKVMAKIIEHELEPPSQFKVVDTLTMARKHAFTSKKLAYLSEKLNKKYKKLSHANFPGKSLWKECMKGNIKAWNEMKKYNIYDILSTEELFLTLAKYEKSLLIKSSLDAYNNRKK